MKAVAGVVGGFLLVLVVAICAMGGGASAGGIAAIPSGPAAGPVGGLNPVGIPASMVPIIQGAASVCPQMPAPLIAAQLDAESGFNANAVSPAGAQGVAQFMPGTWVTWGRDYDHNGSVSVLDPGDAIPAEAHMMCALFTQVQAALTAKQITGNLQDLALDSYNCGFGCVLAAGGTPGNAQTQAYAPKIDALEKKFSLGLTGGPVTGTAAQKASVKAAESQEGLPYVWGGGNTSGPTGTLQSSSPPIGYDCEGLTRYATYQGFHVDIGMGTSNQLVTPTLKTVATRPAGSSMTATLAAMRPGDVVLLNLHPSPDGAWGHVALYVGNGQIVHAPTFGEVVKLAPISDFASADWTVRRVP